jgi:hypothetical protein
MSPTAPKQANRSRSSKAVRPRANTLNATPNGGPLENTPLVTRVRVGWVMEALGGVGSGGGQPSLSAGMTTGAAYNSVVERSA